MSSQLFVTLYTLSIYPSAHKQLRRHLRTLFVNSPVKNKISVTIAANEPNISISSIEYFLNVKDFLKRPTI